MKFEQVTAAIDEIAESKQLSREVVVSALKGAIEKAFLRYLRGGDDAKVEVIFDEKNNDMICTQYKTVVADEDVQDDYLEISIEDANYDLKTPKYKIGDDYPIPYSLKHDDENVFRKVFAMAVKNNLKSKLIEAEHEALYEIYKDRIGDMITGTVEKFDENNNVCTVDIGKTTVDLTKRQLIGNERFEDGDPIKVYIEKVNEVVYEGRNSRNSQQIVVTRSSEGFLKRLFEEEIHEISTGEVIIKDIARESGRRSKVSVYSLDENVDATGACIGPAGTRIQKIVSELGNDKNKEKIDIISWSPVDGLYIAEALRPAQVVGVKILGKLSEEDLKPSAIAVVKDDQLSLAIGKVGVNARLACKLTKFNIDIYPETKAIEEGIDFTTVEDLIAEAEKVKIEKKPVLPEGAVVIEDDGETFITTTITEEEKKQLDSQITYVDPIASTYVPEETKEVEGEKVEQPKVKVKTISLEEKKQLDSQITYVDPLTGLATTELVKNVEEPTETEEASVEAEPVVEEKVAVEETPVVEEKVAEKEPVVEEPVVEEIKEVKTTTTLDALENELTKAKERKTKKQFKKRKKPRVISDEETEVVAKNEPSPKVEALPIYSKAELKEMEELEDDFGMDDFDFDEDEIDYDLYDDFYDEELN